MTRVAEGMLHIGCRFAVDLRREVFPVEAVHGVVKRLRGDLLLSEESAFNFCFHGFARRGASRAYLASQRVAKVVKSGE